MDIVIALAAFGLMFFVGIKMHDVDMDIQVYHIFTNALLAAILAVLLINF